jgi:hypothetical protein
MPSDFIWHMQALLSERRKKLIAFEIGLLKYLQFLGFSNVLQSAQDRYIFSIQQLLTLHHVALLLSWQPGHLSLRKLLHAPQ